MFFPRRSRARGFSLLEVIVALGVFALGIVGVIGLLAPVSKSVSAAGETEAAARVAEAVLARLRALPFDQAALLLQDQAAMQKNDAAGNYNPNDGSHPAVLFAKTSGDVGVYSATRKSWLDASGAAVANNDKYFEIELIRDATLSPAANDAGAAMLAFSVRVRWPSFAPSANGLGVQIGAGQTGAVTFDHGKQQVMFFTGSIRR
jgi:prepilin-type N-terminal cleavage/methylation domain-containing protein